MQNLKPFINSLQNFAQKRLQFQEPPKLFLKQDQENAQNVFGKTAYYDPNEKSITLFTTGRHPKDILRSFAHELVHHCQNLRGDLSPDKFGEMGIDYAQQNKHMREMEREAYEKGNLCFRDWEDGIKVSMQQKNNQLKENKKMVKISKKELKGLIGKILERRAVNEKVMYKGKEIPDLSNKGSFRAAFRAARNMKAPVFSYKGKPYTNKLAGGDMKVKASGELAQRKQTPFPGSDGAVDDVKKAVSQAIARGKKAAKIQPTATGMPAGSEKVVKNMTNPNTPKGFMKTAKKAAKGVMKTAKMPVREDDGAFSDSHYCIHHGGVEHNGSIAMAEAIQHVAPDEKGFISHYDMKLEDGTILENVAAEDIQVTNASLAEAHRAGKRDTHPAYKKDDNIDEDHCGKRDEEDLEEAAKPDFPDVDGDGDTKEPISKAQQDKKEAEGDSKKEEKADEDDKESDKDLSKVPPQLRKHVAKKMKESKIQTPEQEQALYESRFNKRNEEIFDKLKKLWTK